jgi:tetratricopeptide (TPR) repeat protein
MLKAWVRWGSAVCMAMACAGALAADARRTTAKAIATASPAQRQADQSFAQGLALIQAHRWGLDLSKQSMDLARGLLRQAPRSGYGQVLQAEYLAKWQISPVGHAAGVTTMAFALTDEALKFNPRLAQAHATRARLYLRQGDLVLAQGALTQALRLNRRLPQALLLQGDIHRRQGDVAAAETWYRRYVDHVPPRQQSEGHRWIAEMHLERAIASHNQDGLAVAKARAAFESMLMLSQGEDWGHLDHAIFLNTMARDHEAAERHLQAARPELGDHPLWRAHLAAAGYLKLLNAATLQGAQIAPDAMQAVLRASHMTLDETIQFQGLGAQIVGQLERLKGLLQDESAARV